MPYDKHPSNVLTQPQNAIVVAQLRAMGRSDAAMESCAPDVVPNAYLRLGTHPDLVTRLWNEITKTLPVHCRWIVNGRPVLVRPDSGIIFGFALGTHTYGLRLPAAQRSELAAAALQKAEENADRFGLVGDKRQQYVNTHTGDVWAYPRSTFDAKTFGPNWVLGHWLQRETEWCGVAYEFAAA